MNIENAKRIIIKIGSSLLIDAVSGKINLAWLEHLAADIAGLKDQGKEIIIVTSGAVALGKDKICGSKKPLRLEEKQAAAACGQLDLINSYRNFLEEKGYSCAQILLTIDDTENRRRYLNAENTISTLLSAGIIPIINENDSVATAELRFGDNDRLAARVAQMTSADMLVLFSDINGLYDKSPKKHKDAKHIKRVDIIDLSIEEMADGAGSNVGSGGMITKIAAAKIATLSGCSTIIADGRGNNPVKSLLNGASHTIFSANNDPKNARKQWIAHMLKSIGEIVIDDGAVEALKSGKSLLPSGVVEIVGDFNRGDAVIIKNSVGNPLGKGLVTYSKRDAELIMGKKTHEIEAILGYSGRSELIHRNDMALT